MWYGLFWIIILLYFDHSSSRQNSGKFEAKYCSKIFYFQSLKDRAKISMCFWNNRDFWAKICHDFESWDAWLANFFFLKHTVMSIRGIFCRMVMALVSVWFRKAIRFQVDVLTPDEIWNFALAIDILILHRCTHYYMHFNFLTLPRNNEV